MPRFWIVNTCVPGETVPSWPSLFATEAEAHAFADEKMRDEWGNNAPEDDGDEQADSRDWQTIKRLPYPGDWQEAQRILIENDHDGTWGRWEVTPHDLPDAPPAAAVPSGAPVLDAADLARIDSVLTIEADDLAERMNSPATYDGERAEVEAERAGLLATIAKVNAMAGIPSAAPSQSIHVEFLDAAGRLDHNATYPTIQAALADASGRRVVVTGIEPAPSDAPADPVKADMLAALKKAKNWIESLTDPHNMLDEDRADVAQIDAAIARAEGRV